MAGPLYYRHPLVLLHLGALSPPQISWGWMEKEGTGWGWGAVKSLVPAESRRMVGVGPGRGEAAPRPRPLPSLPTAHPGVTYESLWVLGWGPCATPTLSPTRRWGPSSPGDGRDGGTGG